MPRNEPNTFLGWLVPLVVSVLRADPVRQALGEALADAVPNGQRRELLTADELCEALAISRSKLDGLNASGLPSVRVGSVRRFRLGEVIEWLRAQEEAA